ncbi:ABC transporter ATP-binding protein [Salinisphaera orenii]|uniref:ABC transporter ATP-binding protein n=1 Tax=Salinisphaera orenii TaxID=856731 RepID=UPI000DBE06CB
MAIVELKDICKQYDGGETNAVDNFNLKTVDGEFVVLVGPSGCGKTTTMRMIAGLEEITSGELWFGDRNVDGMTAKDRDIAMVFQSYALYPHMTVRENMAFSLKLKKMPKNDIERAINDAAGILGIENLLDRKPKALSGGQRQRVALGRAIVRQPQVFLMDEPLSNLDAKLRVDMRSEIIKLHRKLGVTTFYVTHDQIEAMTMGQRIVVMRDGYIQQIDTPNALYEYPTNLFVAGFIGTPSMNFLDAKVGDSGSQLAGDGFSLAANDGHAATLANYRESKVWAGIRPEHLELAPHDDSQPTNCLAGTVEVIEPLGSVMMVQVNVGEHTITAQLDSHTELAMGDTARLTCASDKLHLFDIDTEQALTGQTRSATRSESASA